MVLPRVYKQVDGSDIHLARNVMADRIYNRRYSGGC